MSSAAYWVITAAYTDGSGEPDVLLVTDNEKVAHAFLRSIERADPYKTVRLTTPASVILSSNTTEPQEGTPQ